MSAESPKAGWVDRLPKGKPLKDELARLVDQDHDEAEAEYYEVAADPEVAALEAAQRRYGGMFRRRLRRRKERGPDSN